MATKAAKPKAEKKPKSETKPKSKSAAKAEPDTAASILAKIEAQAAAVDEARREMESKQIDLKQAKSEYEFEVAKLQRMARKQDAPLFDQGGKAETNGAAPKDWRTVSIDVLGLPASLAEKLRETKLDTIGAIADFTSSGRDLIDIDGIGEANAKKLEDALEAYWARHPLPQEADDEGDEKE